MTPCKGKESLLSETKLSEEHFMRKKALRKWHGSGSVGP
jgi:hypothetical protein